MACSHIHSFELPPPLGMPNFNNQFDVAHPNGIQVPTPGHSAGAGPPPRELPWCILEGAPMKLWFATTKSWLMTDENGFITGW